MTYQPYYVEFARSNGLTPEQQDAALTRPDGSWSNERFIAWIGARHREFKALHSISDRMPYSDEQQAQFLEWLRAA